MDPLVATIAPIVTLIAGGIVVYIVMRHRQSLAEESRRMERGQTEKLFQLGFERAPIGIAYLSSDGSWIYSNGHLLKLLGYERSEFNRTSLRTITHTEDRKREAGMMAALRSGRSGGFTINKRLRRSDGTYRTYRFSISRVGGGAGAVFQCIIDEAAPELDRQNDLAAALDRIPEVSVIGLDSKGMITSWNRGAEELFGYGSDDMMGRPWTRLHERARGKAGEANRELAIAAASGRFEGTDSRRRIDDTVLSVEAVIIPRFRGKDLEGFIEISRDASLNYSAREYKSSYERLQELEGKKLDRLTESNEQMRKELERHAELESSLRDAQDRLRSSNRELHGRVKILSSAVRKLIDQRNSLKETIEVERGQRPHRAEELSAPLPENLDWMTIDRPATEIVSQVGRREGEGVIVFRRQDDEKRFVIRSGTVATCGSNSTDLLLGQLLVDDQSISEDDRRKMIDVQEQTGIALGRLLVLFDLMSESAIGTAMRRKIGRELEELQSWRGGDYAFFKGSLEALAIVPVEAEIADPDTATAGGDSKPEGRAATSIQSDELPQGRTRAEEPSRAPDPVEKPELPDEPAEEPEAVPAKIAGNGFISSSGARRFHLKDCSSVSRIPKRARISLADESEAEARGLSPCRKCIGAPV